MVLTTFTHTSRYGIRFSSKRDRRITQSKGYGLVTLLPAVPTIITNPEDVAQIFYEGELDVGVVLLAVERQRKVKLTYVNSIMKDPFLWYADNTGQLMGLQVRDCREVTNKPSNTLGNWFVRLFSALDTHISRRTR